MATSDSKNLQLESNLKEMGHKLMHPPYPSADHLLPLLDQIENCLRKVDQMPSKSMLKALSIVKKVLVTNHLFRHSNEDVRVAVASCIAQLIRITAPVAPYDDNQMKEVFKLMVFSMKDLLDKSSRSYLKRASILKVVAKCRLSCLMLDLDCDALIIEMFQHFFKAMRDYHPQNVFTFMERIMILVLEESENISMELLLPILHIVKRDNKEVLPIAQKLVVRVLKYSASKLKPYLIQAVKKSGFSVCNYSKIVAIICQETSTDVERNDAVTNDLPVDKAIRKEVGSTKQVDLPNDKSPKLVVSDAVMQLSKEDSLADLQSLKKKDHGHHADRPKNLDKSLIAGPEILGTEKVINAECKSDTNNRLTKTNLLRTEPPESLYVYEKEVENVPNHKKDSKDLPGSWQEDPSVVRNVSLQNQNETGIQPSNLESTKPSENQYIFYKEVETLPDHKKDINSVPGASDEDLPFDMAVSLQNKEEAGIQPSSESTEPSENICICENEVETLSDHKKDNEDAPGSLHENLSIDGSVPLQNHIETVVLPCSPKPKGHELSDRTSSIPIGSVPDAQPQRKDNMINKTTPVINDAFTKESEVAISSEAKQNKLSGERVAAFGSKEDKSPAEIDETEKENGSATASKTRPLEQSSMNLHATSKNGEGLSSKQPELNQKQDPVKCISEKNGAKSSTRNDRKASVSIEYGENPAGLKVKVGWLKDLMFYEGVESLDVIKRNKGEAAGHLGPDAEISKTSTLQDNVNPAEPSIVPTSAINSSLVIHIHHGLSNKRKSVTPRASACEKRVCYNARERTQNSLHKMSSAVKFETTQKESLNAMTLYRKCLEELQDMEGLDDAEFAKAVNVLRDDKNAIAFMTIKGPRRLVWLRSLWQAL